MISHRLGVRVSLGACAEVLYLARILAGSPSQMAALEIATPATCTGGVDRDTKKRAQCRVSMARHRLLKRLAQTCPQVADYLEDTVDTGFTCQHTPVDGEQWDVRIFEVADLVELIPPATVQR